MAFTLGALFEATLLVINAIAILNEERFLRKSMYSVLTCKLGYSLFFLAIMNLSAVFLSWLGQRLWQ